MNKQRPTFSVIIPTYNRPTQTLAAIKSVLRQTYPAHEIIVVDDSPSNDTAEVLTPYQESIRYIQRAKGGTANARNKGIQVAIGDYIAFLDSDDYWRSDKLEIIQSYIERYPNVGIFGSGYYFVNGVGNVLYKERQVRLKGSAYHLFLEGDYAATSAVVIRRDCFDSIGLFDEVLRGCEDWDMWIRTTRHFSMIQIHDALAYITIQTNDRRSNVHDSQWFQGMDAVVAKSLQADPALDQKTRQRIEAVLHYIKGKAALVNGDSQLALHYFHLARTQDRNIYKANIYEFILSNRWLQALIPAQLRARLWL